MLPARAAASSKTRSASFTFSSARCWSVAICGHRYEPDEPAEEREAVDPELEDLRAREPREDCVRGLAGLDLEPERARELPPAARLLGEFAVAAAGAALPDGIAETTPRPAPRATPATARPAVSTPATPYTAPLRATSRTRGESRAAVAAAAIATSDSMKSSAAMHYSSVRKPC
jgi:hypothetical protein